MEVDDGPHDADDADAVDVLEEDPEALFGAAFVDPPSGEAAMIASAAMRALSAELPRSIGLLVVKAPSSSNSKPGLVQLLPPLGPPSPVPIWMIA